MPPPEEDSAIKPFTDDQIELIRRWIAEGAGWPDGYEVGKKEGSRLRQRDQTDSRQTSARRTCRKSASGSQAGAEWPAENPDTVGLADKIREKIVGTTEVKTEDQMAAYTETITTTGSNSNSSRSRAGIF